MIDEKTVNKTWVPWVVAPGSGFEVLGGEVGLVQVSATQFKVANSFRFRHPAIERDLERHLQKAETDRGEIKRKIRLATTYTPTDGETDLASIPPLMRWFENSYGNHTLAAILHDKLIVDEPDGGALDSDTLSDRLFRLMLEAAGMPWLKRWIMWSAVALRTRWAAKGWRRFSLVIWGLLSLVGIGCFTAGMAEVASGEGVTGSAALLVSVAALLPFAAAPLWGPQWAASIIAAVAGIFIIPAASFVLVGRCIYGALELSASILRSDQWPGAAASG